MSSDFYVGSVLGVVRARSLRRGPLEERANVGLLDKLVGVPWQLVPGGIFCNHYFLAVQFSFQHDRNYNHENNCDFNKKFNETSWALGRQSTSL